MMRPVHAVVRKHWKQIKSWILLRRLIVTKMIVSWLLVRSSLHPVVQTVLILEISLLPFDCRCPLKLRREESLEIRMNDGREEKRQEKEGQKRKCKHPSSSVVRNRYRW